MMTTPVPQALKQPIYQTVGIAPTVSFLTGYLCHPAILAQTHDDIPKAATGMGVVIPGGLPPRRQKDQGASYAHFLG